MRYFFFAAGLGVLLLVIWGGVRYFASQKVAELIEQANSDGDSLTVEDYSVRFNFVRLGLEARGIRFQRGLVDRRLVGQVATLDLSGPTVGNLLFGDRPRAERLVVSSPNLTLVPAANTPADTIISDAQPFTFLLDSLVVLAGNLHVEKDDELAPTEMLGLELRAAGLASPFDSASFNRLLLRVDSLHLPNPRQQSDWWFRGLRLSAAEGLSVAAVTLEPRQTAVGLIQTRPYKDTWNALTIRNLTTSPVDLSRLNGAEPVLQLGRASVGDLNFAVFEDPALPVAPDARTKKMPVELLREIPLDFRLDSLNVRRLQVTYGVVMEGEKRELAFTNGRAEFRNLRSRPHAQPAEASIRCLLAGSTPLEARWSLDQTGNGREFQFSGELGTYELANINPFMIVAADTRIESGRLESITYMGGVTNEVASGTLECRYQNLKLKLEGKGSFFKNLFKGLVVKPANPKGGDFRVGRMYCEHDPQRSFFSLYWRAIVSGLRSTVLGKLATPSELHFERSEIE